MADDDVADLDLDRGARRGYPEAVYCEGKSPDQVRVIALAGEGDRSFCSGDDLQDMEGSSRTPTSDNVRTHHDVLIREVRRTPKPVVALLKGFCLGAGFDLALACETLDHKGGLHEIDRKRVKTGTGY